MGIFMLPLTSVITYIKNQNENLLIYLFDDSYQIYFIWKIKARNYHLNGKAGEVYGENVGSVGCCKEQRLLELVSLRFKSLQSLVNSVVMSKLSSLCLFIL